MTALPLKAAAIQAAQDLADVRARHDDAFSAFLVDMDAGEHEWDMYTIELGRASIRQRELYHWARARIEGCENGDPHPGCLCYECGEWYMGDDHNFYTREPAITESAALREGIEVHAKILLKAIGG